jgi:radical SAM superfamily enzyme YgiQ (UPF0313 family)
MRLVFVSIPTYVSRGADTGATARRARRAGETLVLRSAGLYVEARAHRSLVRGLWALASACRARGHEVTWVDAGDDLLTKAGARDRLDRAVSDADQLWLYAMTPTVHLCLRIAEEARRQNPGIAVLVGGPHAHACARELLGAGVDVVSVGFEPSALLAAHVTSLEDMPTTLQRDGRVFRRTVGGPKGSYSEVVDPEVLELPLEAYHLNVSSTVGCAFSCSFCVDGANALRCRHLPELFEELKAYDAVLPEGTLVHCFDTVFGLPRAHFARVADFIATETSRLRFSCDVKANAVNAELAAQLKRSRVRQVSMGVESAAPAVLDFTNKRQELTQCIAAARTLRQALPDAILKAYWVLGLPGTTPNSAEDDFHVAQRLLEEGIFDIVSPKFFVPYPGTAAFDDPRSQGIELDHRDFRAFDRFSSPPVASPLALGPRALARLLVRYDEMLAAHYARRRGTRVAVLADGSTRNPRYNGGLYGGEVATRRVG